MKGIIYKWTCLKSGKSYIGQTINEKRREREFFSGSECYTKEGSKIDNARKKYGLSKNVWKKDVLKRLWCKDGKEEGLLERLNYWEKYYIKEFDTLKNGYNSTDGGSNGFLVSEEVKEKCINAGKTWWNSLTDVEKEKWRKKGIDLWNSLSVSEKNERLKKSIAWWENLSNKEKEMWIENAKKNGKIWWENASEEEKLKCKPWLGKNRYSEDNESNRKKHIGKSKSEEIKEKIRKSVLNSSYIKNQKKPIKQFYLNGDFIKEYDSISSAVNETGFDYNGIIRCAKGSQKTSNGFVWKFSNEKDLITSHKKPSKGYYFHKGLNKYKSRLRYNGKEYNLGFFWNEASAAEMYKYAYKNINNIDEWFKNIEKHKKYIMDKYGN